MTPEQYEQVRALFLAVREEDPHRRAEFLDRACGDDVFVRAEVESLLANDEKADTFLKTPALGKSFAVRDPGLLASGTARGEAGARSAGRAARVATPEAHPQRIGQYSILDILGEGGMGMVYRAELESPRRTVALKVIKPGIESRETLKRLEYEGQVLGWLQHPGIAQVFEAGTADTGQGPRPFFAMEFIRGRPLTEYADVHRLSNRQRLELIAEVCDAVHHAHQKGVIHRDLKPGNILVNESGQPKILDFGIARATDADVRTTTLQTAVGQLVGTLAYMSPEQVSGDPRELDTRSDVYSLGVICFELLTGRVPLDVADKTIPQAVRVIAEEEPASLSSINRVFRGDLATIVAKALEKDKDRRYQSASDLATDIRHYLSDQPISARPVTTFYQLRKFAKRNKVLVATVAIAFVLLSASLIQVTSERNRAVAAERVAEQRREDAERQAAIAQAVNDFLNDDLLAAANPAKLGRDATVRQVLDKASEAVEDRFEDEPLVEAAIRSTLGETYHRLGEYEPAELHLEEALKLRRAELGEQHPETLTSMCDLAMIWEYRGCWDQAEPLYIDALEGRRRLLGEDHPDTVRSMNNLASLYFRQARFDEAEPLLVKAVEGYRRVFGEENPCTLDPMNNLANLYARQGRHDEAEPLMVKTLEAKRRLLGEEHPRTLVSMNNLASVYCTQGRYDEAEPLYAKTLEVRRRVLGEEHPRTFNSMGNLGFAYHNQGRYDEAETLYVEALEGLRRLLGEDHPGTLLRMAHLASLYRDQGRYAEAEPLLVQNLEARRRVLGEDHLDTLASLDSLALLYEKQGRFDQAEPLYREAFEGRRRTLGEHHRETLSSLRKLVASLIALGRFEDAEPLANECYQRHKEVCGPTAGETQDAVKLLVDLYERQRSGRPP